VYDQKFPAVRAGMRAIEEMGRSRADKDTLPWVMSWGGRRLMSEPDKSYKLVNYLVQGGTADLLKDKLVALDSAGYGEMIMLPVHDEVLFNVPVDGFEEHRDAISGIMAEPDAFLIPLTVHPSGPLERWGDVERPVPEQHTPPG
jgi:DNA polymerase-1